MTPHTRDRQERDYLRACYTRVTKGSQSNTEEREEEVVAQLWSKEASRAWETKIIISLLKAL